MTLPPSLQPWFPFKEADGRRGPGRVSLVCFPCAGAGASGYCSWSRLLPDVVDLWSLQLPGRESRTAEEPFTDLGELVEHLGPLLAPQLSRPFVLLGHSLGARIAFEMSRWLRNSGWPAPELLVVAAANAPSCDGHHVIHHLPDQEFLQSVRAYDGLSPAVLARPQLLQMVLPALRADFQMFETYQYRPEAPLECAIVACGGEADRYVGTRGLQDWGTQTSRTFKTLMFPGGHFFMQVARESFIREMLGWLTHSVDHNPARTPLWAVEKK